MQDTGAVYVRDANYSADEGIIRRIRFAVFVDEQGVPAALEMDDRDPACLHVLAFVNGEPVGTGRLDTALHGKVGRVAVTAPSRRRGVGRAVMEALHATARRHGLPAVWCNAQVAAVPFYERLGYRITSGVFDEAGIDHVRMDKPLAAGR